MDAFLSGEEACSLLAEALCEALIGILAVDADEQVVMWNRWLEETSGLEKGAAIGRRFGELFPELDGGRVHNAIRLALEKGCSTLLSQSLNKAPFPLFSRGKPQEEPHRIQQQVYIMPLEAGGLRRHCLVQIFDVTNAVAREKVLREQAVALKRYSHFDSLTGIANRRRFDEHLDEEFRRAQRQSTPLSLIMMDIDFFKSYNDHFGHQAGDRCLIQVAGALNSALRRPGDLAARYGGEEFAVILPETDEAGAMLIAETIRQRVESLRIPHAPTAGNLFVTVSLGVSTLRPHGGTLANELVSQADAALYQAKNDGRNRVKLHGLGA